MISARTLGGAALVLFLLGAAFVPAGCTGARRDGGSGAVELPIIRVRLLSGVDQVPLASTSPAVFTSAGDVSAPRKLDLPTSGNGVPLVRGPTGWQIGSVSLPDGELTIQPDVDGALFVGGARYRGKLRLVPTADGKFDVINHVDIDSYLLGVLASEMFRDWELEAYKAQAIVARTYALYEARTQGAGRYWDVWPDTRSQVYGGVKSETEKASTAVNATRGIVVAYGSRGNERIFKAYFSACCGGVGQNVTDAFGDTYIPPLSERNTGTLCSISKRFNWGPITLSKAELTRRMKIWGAQRSNPIQNIQQVDRIEVSAVNRFGRPVRYIITDVSGQRYTLGGEETRWACNAGKQGNDPILWSSFFKPVNQSTDIVFTDGHGFGHGVGMCQWCAQAMALRGRAAEEIVLYSYPQSALVRAY